MAAMGRGGGKTPERVVKKINEAVDELGQNGAARAIGIPLRSIQKYMQGNSEPTQATLEKLAAYFDVTVVWLRGGESPLDLLDLVTEDEMLSFSIKLGFPGGEQSVTEELIGRGFEEETIKYFLERTKDLFPPELFAKNYKVACEDEIIKPIIDTIYSNMVLQINIDGDWFEAAMQQAGKSILDERIKPLINTIFNLSTQDIVTIAAIVDHYAKNEKFKDDVKLLLNNSVAHSK